MAAESEIHELVMPRLSDTMTEGVVSRWLKSTGDSVARGEPIAEIETDKVTVELESPVEGTLLDTRVADGDAATPGTVIAVIGPEGTIVADYRAESTLALAKPGPHPHRATAARHQPGARPKATPRARRVAAEHGVDLERLVPGSGPGGRILRQDVDRALMTREDAASPESDVLPLSSRQKTAALRMTAAKQEIPHYYLDMTVDVTRLLEHREDERRRDPALDVPVTAYLMRAVALALREFPRVNGSWSDNAIVLHPSVNIGLAVALPDDDLAVPVVSCADTKGVRELAAATSELITRARSGTLTVEDVRGASFTISNLGMFGVDSFHAVINPPESGILAVGAIRKMPVIDGDRISGRDVIQLSLSADHRVYSGATAAAFLSSVRRHIEEPARLLEGA
jgi:pyruvate dehydrogenase E2 component (dihydrolipoamide acetyltransferase)